MQHSPSIQLRVTFEIFTSQAVKYTSYVVELPGLRASPRHRIGEAYNFPRVKKRLRRSANTEGRPVRL